MPVIWPQRLVPCAVRGSLTAEYLGLDKIALGDPGILANRLLDRRPQRQHRVILVPHYTDGDDVAALDLPPGWKVADPRGPVMDVVSSIAAAELVVSSSLHGLIVADAFGIPCVWASSLKPLWGTPGLKFRDHEAARRKSFGDPMNYVELVSLSHERLCELATCPNRDVEEWQNELVEAFPFK